MSSKKIWSLMRVFGVSFICSVTMLMLSRKSFLKCLKTLLISCSAHILKGSLYERVCRTRAKMNPNLSYEEKWRWWLVLEPSLFIEFLFSYIKYHFQLSDKVLPQKRFLLEASFGVLEEVLEAILIDEKKKFWLTVFRICFCWKWLPKVFGRWYWLRWRGL